MYVCVYLFLFYWIPFLYVGTEISFSIIRHNLFRNFWTPYLCVSFFLSSRVYGHGVCFGGN